MQFAQIRDRVNTGDGTAGPIDTNALSGMWVNSNPDSNAIARIVISESDGTLSLQVYAIGPEGLIDWGSARADVYASTPTSGIAAGFTCVFDFGFAEVRLEGMLAKGLLVLAQFHTFKDNSGRADYFVRDYFALDHGRY